ncbi:MAG: D-alanine--D-alanine ligase [Bdellovibrio sp.]|nr:D-alanine--D-alanine ligase [Bdellovibrio sp.]
MAKRPSILVVYGGGGTEHEVSMISARYIIETLRDELSMDVSEVLIDHKGLWNYKNSGGNEIPCFLKPGKLLSVQFEDGIKDIAIDLAVPCIHGPPGETGEIQSHFGMYGIPFLGASPEASIICFNKVSTKLWLDALNIPNTPFIFLDALSENNLQRACDFFQKSGKQPEVFVKASSQGSSVGCYPASSLSELKTALTSAFQYSPYVLVEKRLQARELEISVFEYKDEIHTSYPGEIVCPGKFYSYEEKYSSNSKTSTVLRAQNLTTAQVEQMQNYAKKAFLGLKIRHLSRIDFFLTDHQEIYINEINTFPGLTPISMFPKMMEASGITFATFLKDAIQKSLKS